MDNIIKLLQDKMLVVPENITVKRGNRIVRFPSTGIHKMDDEALYFPANRTLNLCFPVSASKSKLDMLEKKPKNIVVEYSGKKQDTFLLEPIQFSRKVKNLTIDDKKAFRNKILVEKLKREDIVEIPLCLQVALPLSCRNNILNRKYTYQTVIESLARDLKQFYIESKTKIFKKQEKEKNKKFELTEQQKIEMEKSLVAFIKSFDAIEIGFNGTPIIMSYSGNPVLSPNTEYEHYYAVLYRIPCKTAQQLQLKRKIYKCVYEEKAKHILEDAKTKRKEQTKSLNTLAENTNQKMVK